MNGSEEDNKILEKLQQLEAKLDVQHKRLTSLEESVLRTAKAPEPAQGAPPPPPAPVEVEVVSSPPVIEKPEKATDWEHVLGGNWLVKIGITALALGVGFL